MTIDAAKQAEIRRLFYAEHFRRGTIASELGLHVDVVNRVLEHGDPKRPTGRPRSESTLLSPFHTFIDQTLKQYPKLRCTRLMMMLGDRGYKGQIGLVRSYVKGHRPVPKSEVFLRVETLAGEQAQVDWGHVGSIPVHGGKRDLWVFVMVLAYSRAIWAEIVLDMTIHSLLRSLVRASQFFGGCTRQWLFDNPKTVVVQRNGDVVQFNDRLVDLCSQMLVQPKLCRVRRPQDKGKVERSVRYLKEAFFSARTIRSVEQGNAQLVEFLTTHAMNRSHPCFADRTVGDVWQQDEVPLLMRLSQPPPSTDLVGPIRIDKTAFAHFQSNSYSVPSRYAGRTLTLCADDRELRIVDGSELVCSHSRAWGRRERIELAAHRQELVQHKRASSDLKGRDRLRSELRDADLLIGMWADSHRHMGNLVTQTIQLLNLYGASVLQQAVDKAVESKIFEPASLAVYCEQIRRRQRLPPAVAVHFGPHVAEHDVTPHDLGGYDE